MSKKNLISVSPEFDAYLERRFAALEVQSKADAKAIEAAKVEIRKVNEEIYQKTTIREGQEKEYLDLIGKLEDRIKERIKNSATLQLELEAGRISLADYSNSFQTESQIRAEERDKFNAEMTLTLRAIRKLDEEINSLLKSAWQRKEAAEFLRNKSFENKFQIVKRIADELDQLRRSGMEAESIHQKIKGLDLDFPQGHSFNCESIADLELLALKAVVLEEHLPQLHRYVENLKTSNFDWTTRKIEATYTRAPIAAFMTDAGFSFQSIRKETQRLGIVTTGDR